MKIQGRTYLFISKVTQGHKLNYFTFENEAGIEERVKEMDGWKTKKRKLKVYWQKVCFSYYCCFCVVFYCISFASSVARRFLCPPLANHDFILLLCNVILPILFIFLFDTICCF